MIHDFQALNSAHMAAIMVFERALILSGVHVDPGSGWNCSL